MEQRLHDIVFSKKFGVSDWTAAFSAAMFLQKCKGSDIYIWGYDFNTFDFIQLLNLQEMPVRGIIELDSNVIGKKVGGVDIVSVSDVRVDGSRPTFCFILYDSFDCSVQAKIARRMRRINNVICPKVPAFRNNNKKIVSMLKTIGIKEYYYITSHDKDLIFQNQSYVWEAGRHEYYQEHFQDLLTIISNLSDETSREILLEYVRSYCENDLYRLPEASLNCKYFYGNDDNEILYSHLDDEVWVNCGGGKGETLFSFLCSGLAFKSVYCVDEDPYAISILKTNLSSLSETMNVANIHPVQRRISSSTDIKDILQAEKMTLLNADIEGFELPLLQGISDALVEYRPVVAVCLYHRKEDLFEIPAFLFDLMKNYNFYIRKYVASASNKRRNSELVMYAVPRERC